MSPSPLDTLLPVPRDAEARTDYEARFIGCPSVAKLTPPRRHKMAAEAWEAARLRSRVSVKNSAGEFLCFD